MSEALPPLSQYAFMAWCLVKPQGQLYLYLYLYLTNGLWMVNLKWCGIKYRGLFKGTVQEFCWN